MMKEYTINQLSEAQVDEAVKLVWEKKGLVRVHLDEPGTITVRCNDDELHKHLMAQSASIPIDKST